MRMLSVGLDCPLLGPHLLYPGRPWLVGCTIILCEVRVIPQIKRPMGPWEDSLRFRGGPCLSPALLSGHAAQGNHPTSLILRPFLLSAI